jgi:hypothetical protein
MAMSHFRFAMPGHLGYIIISSGPECGEAVPALRPAGIPSAMLRTGLPAVGNKGKMPSPHKELTMAEVKKYIAVDLGAESGRVMLGSVSAERLVLEEIPDVHDAVGVEVHREENWRLPFPRKLGLSFLARSEPNRS